MPNLARRQQAEAKSRHRLNAVQVAGGRRLLRGYKYPPRAADPFRFAETGFYAELDTRAGR